MTLFPMSNSSIRSFSFLLIFFIAGSIPGLAAVTVQVEHNTPGNPDWTFPTLPPPLASDAADASLGKSSASIPSANPPQLFGPELLIDGVAQANNNDFLRSVYFDVAGPNRVSIDIGEIIPVFEINTYSWHANVRANQLFTIFYSLAETPPDASGALATDAELVSAGWTLHTEVNTAVPFNQEHQLVTSVRDDAGAAMFAARHVMIQVNFPYTFLGEIDVLGLESFINGVPTYWLEQNGLPPTAAGAAADTDGDGIPNFLEFANGTDPNDNPNAGPPATPMAVWGPLQAAIENDPLNTEINQTFSVDGITVQLLRYDLGTLTGTQTSGSPKIAAYYVFPTAGANVPGIVDIHGGGQRANLSIAGYWARQGYACLSIDWGGHELVPGKPSTDWDGIPAGFIRPGVTQAVHHERVDPDLYIDGATLYSEPHPMNNSFLLNAYAARRGLTFLAQQPNVDATKLGLTGHSMGGITTVTASIDPRVKAATPSVGGTGWTYEDLWGLPNTASFRDTQHLELYQSAVAVQSYWPLIQAPTLFLEASNDFNAPFDSLQPSMDLLPATTERRIAVATHYNHQFDDASEAARVLWQMSKLGNSFDLPQTPATVLDLTQSSGIPKLRILPDAAAARPLLKVDIYYGSVRYPLERYWHAGDVTQAADGWWEADCPVTDLAERLSAYAVLTYDIGADLPMPPGHSPTTREFSIASELMAAFPDELAANGIQATATRTRQLDEFDDGFQDWYQLFPNNPILFDIGSWKVGDPIYEAPIGSLLAFDVQASTAGNFLGITLRTDWNFRPNTTYAALFPLNKTGNNHIILSPASFINRESGLPLADWSDIKIIQFQPGNHANPSIGLPGWVGDIPTFSSLRWIGGGYADGASPNHSPIWLLYTVTKNGASVGSPYSDTFAASEAIDPEASAMTFRKLSGPAWLVVAPNGTLSGTPGSDDAGPNEWAIQVVDAAGATDTTCLQIQVVSGVEINVEHNTIGLPNWAMASLPPPSATDFASLGNATVTIPTDNPAALFGPELLTDGVAQENNNDFFKSLYFDKPGPNRVLMDLGGLQPVYEINTYTWHANVRANQQFKIYYSTAATAPAADSTVANDAALTAAGWQLLGTVNTLFPWTEEHQIVTQVKNTFSGPLVEATHLLFSVDFEYTFFGEIDILSTESYTPSGVSKSWLLENNLPDNRQALRSDMDGDNLTAEEEFFAGTNPNDDGDFLQFSRIEFHATHQVLAWALCPGKDIHPLAF